MTDIRELTDVCVLDEKERELWAVIRDGMITPGHLAVGESVPMVENTGRIAAVERERDALPGAKGE